MLFESEQNQKRLIQEVVYDVAPKHNLKKQVERRFEDETIEYDSFDVIQEVFDRIYEILGDNSIDIDELIN